MKRFQLFFATVLWMAGGCAAAPELPREAMPRKGATQLWAQACARCHNIRSPSQYSDREWDVLMHHMRVRANLTAEETEVIREYLKSAN